MAFQNYEDMRVGDIIECFRVEMVTRTLWVRVICPCQAVVERPPPGVYCEIAHRAFRNRIRFRADAL